ncbi:importin subunit alpha-4-like isoform X3 [Apium graveolens]|uniref:importin subunit alpha-4-like isoform X3 n=1 Tax=Apium graveolens TaxID=4045 RepID=UPI003D7AB14B
MVIERSDREEETSPVDIICPLYYYVYHSPFVSQLLAFNINKKIARLNAASKSVMVSDKYKYVRELAQLLTTDPRLGDQLKSEVVTRLIQFLENKRFNITFYAAVVLSYIVSSKHGSVIKDETVPYLLNLIPSPDMMVRVQALITLNKIAKVYPDSYDTMIKNGVLELLESLFTNKDKIDASKKNIGSLLERAGGLLTTLCRMKQQLQSDMIKVVRIISIAIVNDFELVLIQICLLISILSDRGFVEIGFEVIRLLDLIDHSQYKIVISALRTIGNYVRWGSVENIQQFMIERGLLLHLKKVLCHEYTIVRKEASWIISNITAVANHSHIQEVIGLGLIDMLIKLVRTEEFEVKEVAAHAIFNAVSGSKGKQFMYLKENCFPLVDEVRSFCHDDGRVVTLCSKILQLDNIGASVTTGTTAADRVSGSAKCARPFEKVTRKKNRR